MRNILVLGIALTAATFAMIGLDPIEVVGAPEATGLFTGSFPRSFSRHGDYPYTVHVGTKARPLRGQDRGEVIDDSLQNRSETYENSAGRDSRARLGTQHGRCHVGPDKSTDAKRPR